MWRWHSTRFQAKAGRAQIPDNARRTKQLHAITLGAYAHITIGHKLGVICLGDEERRTQEKPFRAYTGEEPYVFVCYAHEDADLVYPEIAWLNDHGVNLWYDAGILPGDEWTQELADRIDGAASLVFFISPRSVASRHCRDEVLYALNHDTPVLCRYLEKTTLPGGLELSLGSSQAIVEHELTPEECRTRLLQALGAKTSASVNLRSLTSTPTPRRVPAFLLLALVAILAFATWMAIRPAVQPPVESLMVLPLRNLANDPAQDYFVDGMTEALITDLAKIQNLKVISRTTAMHYKNSDKLVSEIARELDIDAIVEGSVQREGDRIRINAQLTLGDDDLSVWAESVERKLSDILSLQRELARAIAGQVAAALTPGEASRLANVDPVVPAAYEAYLRGRFHWHKLTPQDLESAFRHYELALKLDPEFALAYVGLADALGTKAHALGLVPSSQVYPQSKAAIKRALELDDTLAQAHDVMARIQWVWDRDTDAAEASLQRAIALNPSYPDAHAVYGQVLEATQRCDGAITEAQKALELDPLNSFLKLNYAGRLQCAGKSHESIERLNEVLATEPNSPIALLYLWNALYQKGAYDEALSAAERHFTVQGLDLVPRNLGLADREYTEIMAQMAASLAAQSTSTYVQPTKIARLYAHADEPDAALTWLEIALAQRDTWMVYVKAEPSFQSLRNEPRFSDLMRAIDL